MRKIDHSEKFAGQEAQCGMASPDDTNLNRQQRRENAALQRNLDNLKRQRERSGARQAMQHAVRTCGVLAVAVLMVGCGANDAVVTSARTFLDLAGQDYLLYVEQDGDLTEDEKAIRRGYYDSFDRVVAAAEGE